MIVAILLPAIAIVLFLLEVRLVKTNLKYLKFDGECNKYLVEPEEPLTWSGTVENLSCLPAPFVRLRERFPVEAEMLHSPDWIHTHCQDTMQSKHVEERIVLWSKRQKTRTVNFALPKRGEYSLGSFTLSAGDILGFREETVSGEGHNIVVIPAMPKNRRSVEALGGFLGDRSVRRFILEDPILTVGFRDYTGHEPMKSISWTRTAMTGSLQVKQHDYTTEETVEVLLNVEGATEAQLEACFSLTRMVCEELDRQDIPFTFRTNGDLPGPVGRVDTLSEGVGVGRVRSILYALGRATDTCFFSFKRLVNQSLGRRTGRASYIVITPSLNMRDRELIHQLELASFVKPCVLVGEEEVGA